IGCRPVAARVPEADDVVIAGVDEEVFGVDGGLAGFGIEIGDDPVGIVVGERVGPEELAGAAIEHEDAAGFAHGGEDVTLLTLLDCRVDPLDEFGIGREARVDESALVGVVGIPIVAGQVLVIPGEFAGGGIEGDGGVAVEIGGRGTGDGVGVAVVAEGALVGHGVGDAPVDELADGIVSAGEAPGGGLTILDVGAAPGFIAGLTDVGGGVEAPGFLAGEGVLRGDVAILML